MLREGQGERENPGMDSLLSTESYAGLDPRTPRSRPEQKPRVGGLTNHTTQETLNI